MPKRLVACLLCTILLSSLWVRSFAAATAPQLRMIEAPKRATALSAGQKIPFPTEGGKHCPQSERISLSTNPEVAFGSEGVLVATGGGSATVMELWACPHGAWLQALEVRVTGARSTVPAPVLRGRAHQVRLQQGQVTAWGENGQGQCDTTAWRNILAVGVGNDMTVGFDAQGTLYLTGSLGKHLLRTSIVIPQSANQDSFERAFETLQEPFTLPSLQALLPGTPEYVAQLIEAIPQNGQSFYYADRDAIDEASAALQSLSSADKGKVSRALQMKLQKAQGFISTTKKLIVATEQAVTQISVPFVYAQRATTAAAAKQNYNLIGDEAAQAEVSNRQVLLDYLQFAQEKEAELALIQQRIEAAHERFSYDVYTSVAELELAVEALAPDERAYLPNLNRLAELRKRLEAIEGEARHVNTELAHLLAHLHEKYPEGYLVGINLSDASAILNMGLEYDRFATEHPESTAQALITSRAQLLVLQQRISQLMEHYQDFKLEVERALAEHPITVERYSAAQKQAILHLLQEIERFGQDEAVSFYRGRLREAQTAFAQVEQSLHAYGQGIIQIKPLNLTYADVAKVERELLLPFQGFSLDAQDYCRTLPGFQQAYNNLLQRISNLRSEYVQGAFVDPIKAMNGKVAYRDGKTLASLWALYGQLPLVEQTLIQKSEGVNYATALEQLRERWQAIEQERQSLQQDLFRSVATWGEHCCIHRQQVNALMARYNALDPHGAGELQAGLAYGAQLLAAKLASDRIEDEIAEAKRLIEALPQISQIPDGILEQRQGQYRVQVQAAREAVSALHCDAERARLESLMQRMQEAETGLNIHTVTLHAFGEQKTYSVFHGRSLQLPVAPAVGKIITGLRRGGELLPWNGSSYTLSQVTQDQTVEVMWSPVRYTVTLREVNGLHPQRELLAEHGKPVELPLTPKPGFALETATTGRWENGKLLLGEVTGNQSVTVWYKPAMALTLPPITQQNQTQNQAHQGALTLENGKQIPPQRLQQELTRTAAQGITSLKMQTACGALTLPATATPNEGLARLANTMSESGGVVVGAPSIGLSESGPHGISPENALAVTLRMPHMPFGTAVDLTIPFDWQAYPDPTVEAAQLRAYYVQEDAGLPERMAYRVSYNPVEQSLTIHGLTHASTYVVTHRNLLPPASGHGGTGGEREAIQQERKLPQLEETTEQTPLVGSPPAEAEPPTHAKKSSLLSEQDKEDGQDQRSISDTYALPQHTLHIPQPPFWAFALLWAATLAVCAVLYATRTRKKIEQDKKE